MNAKLTHRTMMRLAFSAAHAFAWVAAFQYFYERSLSLSVALSSVALTYALTHTLVILLTPLAAKNIRNGMRRSMLCAVLAAAGAFAAFGAGYVTGIAWGISAFAMLLGVYRAMYFVPYELSPASRRTSIEILIALMPAAAGLLLAATHQPMFLYFAAAAMTLLSAFPLFRIGDRHEGFAWSYRATFHELFAPEHKALVFSSVCDGIEGATLLFIWPIAVWLLLGQSFPLLGVVLSLTLFVTMAIRAALAMAGFAPTPLLSSAVHATAWLLRIFAANGGAVIAIDSYTAAGGGHRLQGMDKATHEQSADNHTYVDEFTALKEMGNALGRIILCMAIGLLAPANSISLVLLFSFLLAALASMLSTFASHRPMRRAY